MTHAELDALLARSENMPDDITQDAVERLHLDTLCAMQYMCAAMEPFARVVHNGTPSDCGGLLTQSDWERLAQLFAPPRAQE